MRYKVVIPRPVSRRLHDAVQLADFDRNALLRFWNRFFGTLEDVPAVIHRNRVPGRQDCFLFRIVVNEDRAWHVFRFIVNDQGRPGELVLVEFRYDPRKPS